MFDILVYSFLFSISERKLYKSQNNDKEILFLLNGEENSMSHQDQKMEQIRKEMQWECFEEYGGYFFYFDRQNLLILDKGYIEETKCKPKYIGLKKRKKKGVKYVL